MSKTSPMWPTRPKRPIGLGWACTRPRGPLGSTGAGEACSAPLWPNLEGLVFCTGWHVQRADPTLWCTSAWHDNGFRDTAADPKRLLRTGFFPGLGWLLTRALYKGELCLAPRGLALGLGLTLTTNPDPNPEPNPEPKPEPNQASSSQRGPTSTGTTGCDQRSSSGPLAAGSASSRRCLA